MMAAFFGRLTAAVRNSATSFWKGTSHAAIQRLKPLCGRFSGRAGGQGFSATTFPSRKT